MGVAVVAMVIVMVAVDGWAVHITAIRIRSRRRCLGRQRRLGLQLAHGTFDDFVQLAAIQPDPAAFGTVIDFNTLAVSHDQVCFHTNRTFHNRLFI